MKWKRKLICWFSFEWSWWMKWIVCCRAAHSLRSWLCVMGYGFDAQQTQLHSTQLHSINLSFVSLISILPSLLLFINDWRGKLSWWNQLWLMKSILNAAEGRCPPITSNWRKKEKRSESNQSIPQLIWLMDCFLFKERGREEELIKKKTFNLFHEINWYYTSKMSKSNSTNFHQIFNLIERVGLLIWFVNCRLAGPSEQSSNSTSINEIKIILISWIDLLNLLLLAWWAEQTNNSSFHQQSIHQIKKVWFVGWFVEMKLKIVVDCFRPGSLRSFTTSFLSFLQ